MDVKQRKETVLWIVILFALIRVITGYITPFVIVNVFNWLPKKTSLPFANNLVRLIANCFIVISVIYYYKFNKNDNPFVWKESIPASLTTAARHVAAYAFFLYLNKDLGGVNVLFDITHSEAFSIVLVAPIAEELLYRGFLFRRLDKYIGRVPALLISSLIFSFAHDNVIGSFGLGCVLCAIYMPVKSEGVAQIRTGYLWPSIVLHALVNLKYF